MYPLAVGSSRSINIPGSPLRACLWTCPPVRVSIFYAPASREGITPPWFAVRLTRSRPYMRHDRRGLPATASRDSHGYMMVHHRTCRRPYDMPQDNRPWTPDPGAVHSTPLARYRARRLASGPWSA